MNQTIVSTKYQVVIPRLVRNKIKVKPGQKMNIYLSGGQIILSPELKKHNLSWPHEHLIRLQNPWLDEVEGKYLDEERNSWEK